MAVNEGSVYEFFIIVGSFMVGVVLLVILGVVLYLVFVKPYLLKIREQSAQQPIRPVSGVARRYEPTPQISGGRGYNNDMMQTQYYTPDNSQPYTDMYKPQIVSMATQQQPPIQPYNEPIQPYNESIQPYNEPIQPYNVASNVTTPMHTNTVLQPVTMPAVSHDYHNTPVMPLSSTTTNGANNSWHSTQQYPDYSEGYKSVVEPPPTYTSPVPAASYERPATNQYMPPTYNDSNSFNVADPVNTSILNTTIPVVSTTYRTTYTTQRNSVVGGFSAV